MNEAAYMGHRTQSQKTSRGISGFGSESLWINCDSPEYDPHIFNPRSKLVSDVLHSNSTEESTILLVNEEYRHSTIPLGVQQTPTYSDSVREWEADNFSPNTSEKSWGTPSVS